MPSLNFWWWPALSVRLQLEHRAILRYAFYLLPLTLLLTLLVSFWQDWHRLSAALSKPVQDTEEWLMLRRTRNNDSAVPPEAIYANLKHQHADLLTASALAFQYSAKVHPAGMNGFELDVLVVDEAWTSILGLSIAEGRAFNQRDRLTQRAVCLLGADVAVNWFRDTQAVGQALQFNGLWCRVTGVLAAEGRLGEERNGGLAIVTEADKRLFLLRNDDRIATGFDEVAMLFQTDAPLLGELRRQLILSLHKLWPNMVGWRWDSQGREQLSRLDRLQQWIWFVAVLSLLSAVPTLWALFRYFRGMEIRYPIETSLRLQLGATVSELRCLRVPVAILISGLSSAGVLMCLGWLSLLDNIWVGLWWRPDVAVIRVVVFAVMAATLLTAAASVLGLKAPESDFWPQSD